MFCHAFNPREWGTCFARQTKLGGLKHGIFDFQSSWVRNLFCKIQEMMEKISSLSSFNPREWGTCFASLRVPCQFPPDFRTFNPREWGTCFARWETTGVWRRMRESFQSSWVRNLFCKWRLWRRRTTPLSHLSILVSEELVLQVNFWGGFWWRTVGFQSSWVRNLFCKFPCLLFLPL